MKKMTRFTSLLCGAALLLSLCACGAKTEESKKDDAAAEKFTVGVCQLVQHEALDAATNGFIDTLKAEFGENITIVNQNASGDIATCATIVNGFVSDGVDLILANATPALQAAASATDSIPVLGTAITEYGVALDLQDFNGTVGGHVSGTSDLAPLDQQAAMFDELIPEAGTIGILYCSAEANSIYQAQVVGDALEAAGKTVKVFTFADSNDVATVTQSACEECDALYIPTDNVAASCAAAINNVAEPAGVPIICGEENICKGCGIATLSINYYDLGVTTGKMAAKILKGEADVSTMPVEYTNATKLFNAALCDEYGIKPLDGYSPIE